MDLKQVLYGIERELATGDGVAYRRHLIDDAIVIVPGQRLDEQQTIAAIDASSGWDEVELDDETMLDLRNGSAQLAYGFRGRRGQDFRYEALMGSTYVRRKW